MKPTQEQIDAALAFAKFEDTEDQFTILEKACQRTRVSVTLNSCVILAAAYRELQEAIRVTITENLHLADGDDCTLKRLKDVIKFKLPEDQ